MRCSIINEMNTLKRHTRKTELFPAQGISRKTRNLTGLGVLDEFHRAASFIRNFSARRAATSEIALAFANTLKSPHAVCAEPRDSGEFPFSDTTPRRQGENKKRVKRQQLSAYRPLDVEHQLHKPGTRCLPCSPGMTLQTRQPQCRTSHAVRHPQFYSA